MVDAFYQITVPEGGQIKITSTAFFTFTYVSIFSECGGEELFCGPALNEVLIDDLPPGEQAIIQFFSIETSNFFMCIEDVPPTINNTCNNATSVSVQNAVNCNENKINLSLSNNNLDYQPDCANTAVDLSLIHI